MLYNTNLVVYLWMLPVLTLISLPLLTFLVHNIRNILIAGIQTKSQRPVSITPAVEPQSKAEQRRQQRMGVTGIIAHISDGDKYCSGEVHDISEGGLRLKSPPDILNKQATNLGVLLTGFGKTVQMEVYPRWQEYNGSQHLVGASIDADHWNWQEFVLHFKTLQLQENG